MQGRKRDAIGLNEGNLFLVAYFEYYRLSILSYADFNIIPKSGE